MIGFLTTIGFLALAIVLLLIMITIHEFGHYIAGKLLHFKIYEFSIGFGKAIYKKTKKNGEVFSLRLIPLGGYCSFGEDDERGNDDKDPNAFNNQAPWKRLIVFFMGAFFNFLSAVIFCVVLLCIIGYARTIYISAGTANGIAGDNTELAEQLKGQYIEKINGASMSFMPTSSAKNILENFREKDNITLSLVTADGARTEYTVTMTTRDQYNAIISGAPDYSPTEHIRNNIGGALLKAVPASLEIAWVIMVLLFQLVTGQLGMEGVGGTIATITVMTDGLEQAVSYGIMEMFAQISFLITLISINLAVFNLLPIPSLDGSRMVFVVIEWIRGKPINRDLEAKIHLIGIICLFGFIIFADIYYAVSHYLFVFYPMLN
jgi:regulator of sigma E protease